MADLSGSATRKEYEEQREQICQLKNLLAEAERQINEKELLMRKLHNTILVLPFSLIKYLAFHLCFAFNHFLH